MISRELWRKFLVLPTLMAFFPGLSTSVAAPLPATGSSVLTDPTKSVFFRSFGFQMQPPTKGWEMTGSAGDSTVETLRFEPAPREKRPAASVALRIDQIPAGTDLDRYARKWMRDYPSYGFEVLGTRSLNLGGGKAVLVDFIQKSKNRQLRQVILQKNQQVAVVTCLDRRDQFDQTLSVCNQVLKSFQWNSDSSSR